MTDLYCLLLTDHFWNQLVLSRIDFNLYYELVDLDIGHGSCDTQNSKRRLIEDVVMAPHGYRYADTTGHGQCDSIMPTYQRLWSMIVSARASIWRYRTHIHPHHMFPDIRYCRLWSRPCRGSAILSCVFSQYGPSHCFATTINRYQTASNHWSPFFQSLNNIEPSIPVGCHILSAVLNHYLAIK